MGIFKKIPMLSCRFLPVLALKTHPQNKALSGHDGPLRLADFDFAARRFLGELRSRDRSDGGTRCGLTCFFKYVFLIEIEHAKTWNDQLVDVCFWVFWMVNPGVCRSYSGGVLKSVECCGKVVFQAGYFAMGMDQKSERSQDVPSPTERHRLWKWHKLVVCSTRFHPISGQTYVFHLDFRFHLL